eukprot:TRINITY_DN14640_c0_g1_i1.p1 TRINITY_DN14640_c0_g1~~TRINITY_DN14640_c0_g1_i1.p1  ORF type:complete len:311 (+),score=42.75 TRINITY_DN14640_c0_g1_i1:37-933(+)
MGKTPANAVSITGAVAGSILEGCCPHNLGLRIRVLQNQDASGSDVMGKFVVVDSGTGPNHHFIDTLVNREISAADIHTARPVHRRLCCFHRNALSVVIRPDGESAVATTSLSRVGTLYMPTPQPVLAPQPVAVPTPPKRDLELPDYEPAKRIAVSVPSLPLPAPTTLPAAALPSLHPAATEPQLVVASTNSASLPSTPVSFYTAHNAAAQPGAQHSVATTATQQTNIVTTGIAKTRAPPAPQLVDSVAPRVVINVDPTAIPTPNFMVAPRALIEVTICPEASLNARPKRITIPVIVSS